MTTKVTPPTKDIKFQFHALNEKYNAEGTTSYEVEAKAPFRSGYSQFPTKMFVQGEHQEATVKALKLLKDGDPVTLVVSPKLKKDRADDGTFGNYFWNVVGIAAQQPATQPAPPAHGEPVEPQLRQTWPVPDRHQMAISWGQSINCAVARIGIGAVDDSYFKVIEQTANRFYPIILGGPTQQPFADTEPPLPGPEAPGAPSDEAGAAVAPVPAMATLGDFYTEATKLGFPTVRLRMDVSGVAAAIEAKDYQKAWRFLAAAAKK